MALDFGRPGCTLSFATGFAVIVRRHLLAILPALALALSAAAGCGGGQSHSSATTVAVTPGPGTPSNGSPPTTTSRTGPAKTAGTHPAGGTAPGAPAPAPPPPDGLRASTGFATYENCSAACTGSVDPALRRPLKLSPLAPGAPCPATHGSLGPVSPVGFAAHPTLMPMPFINTPWGGQRVTWAARASYAGPILIRGRQLDGPHAVGFGVGNVPYDELQLSAPGMGAPAAPGGGREWLSFTRVRGPGCYAYQVDGERFSTVIVFAAR